MRSQSRWILSAMSALLALATCTRPPQQTAPTRSAPAVPADPLASADWRLRLRAVQTHQNRGDPKAVALLARATRDTDARVRHAALRACGVLRSPKLLPALKAALRHRDRTTKTLAVTALGRIGTVAAAEALIDRLDGRSMWLRPLVADALAGMPLPVLTDMEVALSVLVSELNPSQPPRFRRIVRVFQRLKTRGLAVILNHEVAGAGARARPDRTCARGPCRALVAMGPSIIKPLLRLASSATTHPDRAEAIAVAVFLRMGTPALGEMLKRLGESGRTGDIARAVLLQAGARAAVDLIRVARTPGGSGRLEAIRLLGKLRMASSFACLVALSSDKKTVVASAAVEALREDLQKRPLSRLLSIARGKGSPALRQVAVRTLGCRTDPRGYKLLVRLARGRTALRKAALLALATLASPRARRLVRRLARTQSPKLRKRLASAKTKSFCSPDNCQQQCAHFGRCMNRFAGRKAVTPKLLQECHAECRKNPRKFAQQLKKLCN